MDKITKKIYRGEYGKLYCPYCNKWKATYKQTFVSYGNVPCLWCGKRITAKWEKQYRKYVLKELIAYEKQN